MLPRAETEERDDGGGYRFAVLFAEAVFYAACFKTIVSNLKNKAFCY